MFVKMISYILHLMRCEMVFANYMGSYMVVHCLCTIIMVPNRKVKKNGVLLSHCSHGIFIFFPVEWNICCEWSNVCTLVMCPDAVAHEHTHTERETHKHLDETYGRWKPKTSLHKKQFVCNCRMWTSSTVRHRFFVLGAAVLLLLFLLVVKSDTQRHVFYTKYRTQADKQNCQREKKRKTKQKNNR